MVREDRFRWLKDKNIEKYNYASFVGYKDGYFTIILENLDDKNNTKVKLLWEKVYSYMETNESYREDLWIDDHKDYWPFYKLEESSYLSFFKSNNKICKDENIYHFVIIGEEVVDILSNEDPHINFIKESKNEIYEFSKIYGDYVEEIYGQSRLGYSLSDLVDFFEIPEIIEYKGFYKGDVIRFHDFKNGKVYIPFKLEKNVAYGNPIYLNNSYYFLRIDFSKGNISIYKYYPEKYLKEVRDFNIEEVNLYNLSIVGKELHLISNDSNLEIYYPYRKTIELNENETALFIDEDKVYISAWVEKGWDDEKNVEGPEYEYYDKFIIKDLDGNILSDKKGNLLQHYDGKWWVS